MGEEAWLIISSPSYVIVKQENGPVKWHLQVEWSAQWWTIRLWKHRNGFPDATAPMAIGWPLNFFLNEAGHVSSRALIRTALRRNESDVNATGETAALTGRADWCASSCLVTGARDSASRCVPSSFFFPCQTRSSRCLAGRLSQRSSCDLFRLVHWPWTQLIKRNASDQAERGNKRINQSIAGQNTGPVPSWTISLWYIAIIFLQPQLRCTVLSYPD